mmetsp:Transcript_19039/g.28352  ORF Transcript_19039/g.28352 Transcript_19039/m.28352 type:complete len:173 (-) Transcript_19039:73-591(-)
MKARKLVVTNSCDDQIVFVGSIPARYMAKSKFICPGEWFAHCDYLYFTLKQQKNTGFSLICTNYSAKRNFDCIVMASLLKTLAKLGSRPYGSPILCHQRITIPMSSSKNIAFESLQDQINFSWNLPEVYQRARNNSLGGASTSSERHPSQQNNVKSLASSSLLSTPNPISTS